MPTIAPISRCSERRSTLIIRSVPMLPEPMTATFVFVLLMTVLLVLGGRRSGR